MKKHIVTGVVMLTLALSCLSVVGCAQQTARVDVNADVPAGAAPLMPIGHEGRFESLGAYGCYGCHGVNQAGEALMADATALPENHYQDAQVVAYAMDPVRMQCNTCHPQAADE